MQANPPSNDLLLMERNKFKTPCINTIDKQVREGLPQQKEQAENVPTKVLSMFCLTHDEDHKIMYRISI